MQSMTISQLARAAEVGVETVRYYQRRGLIAVPPTRSGIRRYEAPTLVRLRFIRRAQGLGFSLEEIGDLLGLDEHTDRVAARAIAREKLTQIEERIAQLQAMAHALRDLVACCEHSPAAQPCPILHTLAQPTRADSYSKSTGAG
ncbi:MAG: MerR family DNA-binding protein [Rhodocyclaceae bacterium]|nr:MerR family DNA-binding protein [Rhodocyclaceae bacterium]MCB1964081.1 MerR family DNA-binding protein [Rhodocyclaceae bacterium]